MSLFIHTTELYILNCNKPSNYQPCTPSVPSSQENVKKGSGSAPGGRRGKKFSGGPSTVPLARPGAVCARN